MRASSCLFYFLILCRLMLAQQAATIKLEDIWDSPKLSQKGVPGFNFLNDGIHYTQLNQSTIEKYDLRTGEKTAVIFDAAHIGTAAAATGWPGKFDGYTFSADESKCLLSTQTEKLYRYSTHSHFFVYDTRRRELTRLHHGNKQRYATFSPDNQKIAFECDNNLYFKDLTTGKVVQITSDGQPHHIINGASDWVYEEEFELVRAFEWSYDSRKIAFLKFDESEVPEFALEKYTGEDYPQLVRFKYPKVGEQNAIVSVWCFDILTAQLHQVASHCFDAQAHYLPRITWTPRGKLCISQLNRHQNHLQLIEFDPATANCRILYEEKNPAYIELHDVKFLTDGSAFIVQSEKNGYNHLYLHDAKTGRLLRQLTSGNYDITQFYGVDEKRGRLFFQAARNNARQREIYSVNLKGRKWQTLAATPHGTHGARFSKTFDYFVHTFSTINTPVQYEVCDRTGKTIRKLEQNEALRQIQQNLRVAPVEFFSFQTTDNITLDGWMIRPGEGARQGKKLPVLMFVYGGPGSQQVTDAWKGANYWWFQMLVQHGFVVACVDNRGTGGRGEAFKKVTYLNLGKYEVQDQIEAARWLGRQPYVDAHRIGIFGWSYGGFLSTNCLLKGADVFKAAIAVAPVTHWKWYDSVYTERYMRTEAENPTGYAENSPVNYAEKLQGNYLLIHGLADDNVHFQHTAEMANRLIAANKPFDTMIYPNYDHSIAGGKARLHLYTLMTQFVMEKLK